MSDHPWAHIPALIEAGVLTPEDARDNIVFAQRSTLRRAFRELQGLLVEMHARDEITPKGLERIQGVIVRAQADEAPDA
mgnify:CR=1 FL=1